MTYAFVEVKELKSKGISLPISTVSPAYKKLKNCNEGEYLINIELNILMLIILNINKKIVM